MSFTKLLDNYLKAKIEFDIESSKGYMSTHWTDTYGLGMSKVSQNLDSARKELDKYMEKLVK